MIKTQDDFYKAIFRNFSTFHLNRDFLSLLFYCIFDYFSGFIRKPLLEMLWYKKQKCSVDIFVGAEPQTFTLTKIVSPPRSLRRGATRSKN